jgi:hypothetical protein
MQGRLDFQTCVCGGNGISDRCATHNFGYRKEPTYSGVSGEA